MKTTRLRVTMREVEPPVVRVLDIPGGATLPEVHDLLQAGIGWTDSHLHLFETDSSRYGIPDPDFGDDDPNHRDERTATLRDLPLAFVYHYD
ncbi:IS1096 element passenger TnpR family protein, partial [Dietzia sp. UBA5065]|uniref:IS1096 element passenger TnpR family protein n=1 Tax=Dietzia sp. UBA5065 TaxID=1946422 RepID=UPI0039C89AA6